MRRSFIAALASLVFVLAACGIGAAADKVLTIANGAGVTTLVPWRTTSDNDGYMLRQIYQPLLAMNARSEFVPNAAKEWHVSEDGKTWTVTIRDDLYWQRGNGLFGDELVNVTAEDVKWSYEYYLTPESQSVRHNDLVSTIKEINVKDKYTVEFVTKDIDVLFEYKMYQNYIIPRRAVEKGWDLEASPVGSGAYKFVEHVIDGHVILEKNADFWREPGLDRVVFKIVPDRSVSAIALQNREVDIALTVQPSDIESISQTDFLELRPSTIGSLRWAGFNCKDPLFADAEVRRALRQAVDIDGAVKVIFQNSAGIELARRAYSCIPDERPGGDLDGSAKAMTEPYDPKSAEARLDALGWHKGPDGIRAKDGRKMQFKIQSNANNTVRERFAVIISTQLRAIGVDCSVQLTEWGVHTEDIRKGTVQMYVLGGYSNLDGGKRLMETNEKVMSPNCGYSNSEIDAMLKEAWRTTDLDARSAILRKCAAIFQRDAAHLGAFFEYGLMGVNRRVKDFAYASSYHPLCGPDRNVTVAD